MLNLSQRLILGYLVIAGLLVGLVELTHRALAAAGQLRLAWIIVIAAIVVELGTAFLVLRPIQGLARDAHKIAQGNLEYRTEWKSHDNFGVIAAESRMDAIDLFEPVDDFCLRQQSRREPAGGVTETAYDA